MAAINTRVEFMYRDASNYKCHKYEIFAGEPSRELISRLCSALGKDVSPDEIAVDIGQAFDMPDGAEFNPDQVGLLNLRREEMPGHYDDDNDIHEITSVRATTEALRYDERTFEQFVIECEQVDEWFEDTEQAELDASPHVQVTGNPAEGFYVQGPFPTKAAALAYQAAPGVDEPKWALPLHAVRS